MVNFGPLTAEIGWRARAPELISTGFGVLAALLHGIENLYSPDWNPVAKEKKKT